MHTLFIVAYLSFVSLTDPFHFIALCDTSDRLKYNEWPYLYFFILGIDLQPIYWNANLCRIASVETAEKAVLSRRMVKSNWFIPCPNLLWSFAILMSLMRVKVGTHDGTSPCNKSQGLLASCELATFSTKSSRRDQNLVPATRPMNSNWFEFVGLVAGTSRIVAGTSRIVPIASICNRRDQL